MSKLDEQISINMFDEELLRFTTKMLACKRDGKCVIFHNHDELTECYYCERDICYQCQVICGDCKYEFCIGCTNQIYVGSGRPLYENCY